MYELFCYEGKSLRLALRGKLPSLYRIAKLKEKQGHAWFLYRNWHDSSLGEKIPPGSFLGLLGCTQDTLPWGPFRAPVTHLVELDGVL